MATRVFLTVDTELMWRHHAAGLPVPDVVARSLQPAGVGIAWQLQMLADHGLKACFFVDPMPVRLYGRDAIKPVVDAILAAGQEVQLHLHPNWRGATLGDGGTTHGPFELIGLSRERQSELIAEAAELLVSLGAPRPVAFRAGSYAADDATLDALRMLGIRYDSSHNGSQHPWPSGIGLPPRTIAPAGRAGVIEVPVTTIEDAPGRLRHFQICALSVGEMRAALRHARDEGHVSVTIVSHGFELANRAGTRANAVHVRRFAALCAMLATDAEALPTTHFAEHPFLALDRADAPLGPGRWRTARRQAEQLWSNLVEERAA